MAQAHLRHLSPFPANLGEVLAAYDKVLVPEMNLGQLALLLRAALPVDVISYNQVRGLPFRAAELADVIQDVIDQCLTLPTAVLPTATGRAPRSSRPGRTGWPR